MVERLKRYFEADITCQKINGTLQVPLMLAKRELYRVSLNGVSFVVIKTGKEEPFGIVALKKQKKLYMEQLQSCIAFEFDKVTKAQRDSLIKNRIPFISFPEQVYLPFLGVVLSEQFRKEKEVHLDRMAPTTQQLFLLLLYQKDIPISKSTAAEELGITRTSLTRASEQLLAMKLIEQKKVGKEIRMFRKYEPRIMFEKAKPYLINPIQEKIAVRAENLKAGWLYAGESALSAYSMLNPPKISEVAVYKNVIDRSNIQKAEPKWEEDTSIVMMELWKYDPFLFSNGASVDPVSLICSLKECEDERVENAIDEMMEEWNGSWDGVFQRKD